VTVRETRSVPRGLRRFQPEQSELAFDMK